MGKRTLASRADRHELYQLAVQDADEDAKTMAKLFRRYREREPLILREDFCGTAALSTAWVKAKAKRRAVGVDLDGPTLAWGRERNVQPAGPDVARRLELIEGDVMDGLGPKSDITCALNFSFCIFKERPQLLAYFEQVRGRLKKDGVFILDILGGTETHDVDWHEHDHNGFVYHWEQERFDPLTHDILCHIHFEFRDGSKFKRAFTYDWRLWTPPELRDVLMEAGFSQVHVLWERTDDEAEGTGVFYEPKTVENQESWWTYLVAER